MSVLRRNNVTVSGEGRPIVFSHGFGCDQNMWRFVAPAFRSEHRVVLFDYVGAGRSDWSAYQRSKYSSLDGHAEDVLELCAALALRDAVFVGHSFSAMVGVLAAIAEPALFSRLVLVAPSARYIDDVGYVGGFSQHDIIDMLDALDSNYLGWSSLMAPVIVGNPERPELGNELVESFCRADPEIAKHFARVVFTADNRKDLPKVRTPSLVLQCSHDPIAPLEVGRYVHEHLTGSKFVQLRATGHCPNLSAPEETASAIQAFLSEAGPSA